MSYKEALSREHDNQVEMLLDYQRKFNDIMKI